MRKFHSIEGHVCVHSVRWRRMGIIWDPLENEIAHLKRLSLNKQNEIYLFFWFIDFIYYLIFLTFSHRAWQFQPSKQKHRVTYTWWTIRCKQDLNFFNSWSMYLEIGLDICLMGSRESENCVKGLPTQLYYSIWSHTGVMGYFPTLICELFFSCLANKH